MRPAIIIAIIALLLIIVALLSVRVVTAVIVGPAHTAAQPGPINIMQMMRDAKNLPAQQFDAI